MQIPCFNSSFQRTTRRFHNDFLNQMHKNSDNVKKTNYATIRRRDTQHLETIQIQFR